MFGYQILGFGISGAATGTGRFGLVTWTGDGTTGRAITGLGLSPDFVITKSRDAIGNPYGFYDDGTMTNLQFDSTAAGSTNPGPMASFDSDGFTTGTNASALNVNTKTYVGYGFKESQSLFDIVNYTGTGVAHSIAHNLNTAPKMMIVKRTDGTKDWQSYHIDGGPGVSYQINDGVRNSASTYWNGADPTSSVFSVGTSNTVNGSGQSFKAFLFAEEAGSGNIGNYTGNGSATGPTVNCGFDPDFVLIWPNRSSSIEFLVLDTGRGINAGTDPMFDLGSTAAEVTGTDWIDHTGTGFQVATADALINDSGIEYLYYAAKVG